MDSENQNPQGLDPIDLRPGLLVVVDISRRGGCSYRHENESVAKTESGAQVKSYNGIVTLDDPAEYSVGTTLCSSVKYRFSKLGAHIPVGIIVPLSRFEDVATLDRACQAEVKAFNDVARFTRIDYTTLTFKITGENVRALERMLDELSQGLGDLEKALASLEPQEMRDVLQRMSGYVEMLPDEAAAVLQTTLSEAKKTANTLSRGEKYVTRLEKKLAILDAGPDPQETVDRLLGEDATRDMRDRAKVIQKILDDKADTIEKIATTWGSGVWTRSRPRTPRSWSGSRAWVPRPWPPSPRSPRRSPRSTKP
jgi:hypothetical protein